MPDTATPRRGPKPNPATRTNLLHAGVTLIHRRGFNATGIKDIVDEAGVPKGSFYNHFPSKESFSADVIDTYFQDNLTGLRDLLENADAAPLDRLRNYFRQRTERLAQSDFEKGCLLGNLSLEVADHSAVVRSRLSRNFAVWQALFEQCITEAQDSGEISPQISADALATYLLDGWEGALLRARSEKTTDPLDVFIEITFNALLT